MNTTALLDNGDWQGKIWTGSWTGGGGGTYTAVEPATGEGLAEVGRATPADVSAAAGRAVEAQRSWAAPRTPNVPPCCGGPGTC